MYLTYEEYTKLGGRASCEAAYNRLEFWARKLIDMYTFGRLTGLPEQSEAVKNLVFELLSSKENEGERGQVMSVSNDGYSENYAAVDSDKKAANLIRSYLANEKTADGVPVLYQGVK